MNPENLPGARERRVQELAETMIQQNIMLGTGEAYANAEIQIKAEEASEHERRVTQSSGSPAAPGRGGL